MKQPPCLCLRVGVGAVSQHVFSLVLFTGVFFLCLFTSPPPNYLSRHLEIKYYETKLCPVVLSFGRPKTIVTRFFFLLHPWTNFCPLGEDIIPIDMRSSSTAVRECGHWCCLILLPWGSSWACCSSSSCYISSCAFAKTWARNVQLCWWRSMA